MSDQRLYAAPKQIDRGVMSPSTRGSMHGEIGQTQFLPKNILAYGTGNLDVAANALNSTANFLKARGWSAGGGYQPGEANFADHIQFLMHEISHRSKNLLSVRHDRIHEGVRHRRERPIQFVRKKVRAVMSSRSRYSDSLAKRKVRLPSVNLALCRGADSASLHGSIPLSRCATASEHARKKPAARTKGKLGGAIRQLHVVAPCTLPEVAVTVREGDA